MNRARPRPPPNCAMLASSIATMTTSVGAGPVGSVASKIDRSARHKTFSRYNNAVANSNTARNQTRCRSSRTRHEPVVIG